MWKNPHAAELRDTIKSTWYTAIHDIIPTNERLAAIHLVPQKSYSYYRTTDILLHRITRCGKSPVIRNWARARIVEFLRIHPYVLEEWTLCPLFQYKPEKRQAAVIWVMAQLVPYPLHTQRRLSLIDYMDFLHRARLKEKHRTSQRPKVGRYLDML